MPRVGPAAAPAPATAPSRLVDAAPAQAERPGTRAFMEALPELRAALDEVGGVFQWEESDNYADIEAEFKAIEQRYPAR